MSSVRSRRRRRPELPCGCPVRALSREALELERGAPPCTFRRTLKQVWRGLPGGRFDPERRQPRPLVERDADLVRLRRPGEPRHSGQGYCLGGKHPNRYAAAARAHRRGPTDAVTEPAPHGEATRLGHGALGHHLPGAARKSIARSSHQKGSPTMSFDTLPVVAPPSKLSIVGAFKAAPTLVKILVASDYLGALLMLGLRPWPSCSPPSCASTARRSSRQHGTRPARNLDWVGFLFPPQANTSRPATRRLPR
jgi:hypothetical protein